MAKKINVSDDSGVTWHTLPGGTGEKSSEGANIEDTIFGNTFNSGLTGLISLTISANALYKGFAGYVAKVLKQGSSTAMTGEAMTLVSGKRYRITDATKSIWDRSVAFTVYDGVTDVTSEVESFNYLFGEVLFKSTYTVVGSVTVDGSYFPTTVLGKGNAFELTQTADAIDTTTFALAQANGGYITRDPGLRQVALTLDGIFDSSATLLAELTSRNELIIEINPDGNGKSKCRGFFRASSHVQAGDVGALETESVDFTLNVPEGVEIPFGWQHANDTTLSRAIQIILNAWQNETKVDVQYLYDGVAGDEMTAVVTDVSLSSGLSAMNEFTANFASDGAPSAV